MGMKSLPSDNHNQWFLSPAIMKTDRAGPSGHDEVLPLTSDRDYTLASSYDSINRDSRFPKAASPGNGRLDAETILLWMSIALVLIVAVLFVICSRTGIVTKHSNVVINENFQTEIQGNATVVSTAFLNSFAHKNIEPKVADITKNASADVEQEVSNFLDDGVQTYAKLCSPLGFECANGGTPNRNCTECTSCNNLFSGPKCANCTVACENGGVLNVTSCVCNCLDGSAGVLCSDCDLECKNNGTRTSTGCACDCPSVWIGRDCSLSNPHSTTTELISAFSTAFNNTVNTTEENMPPSFVGGETSEEIELVSALGRSYDKFSGRISRLIASELLSTITYPHMLPNGVTVSVPVGVVLENRGQTPKYPTTRRGKIFYGLNDLLEAVDKNADSASEMKNVYLFSVVYGSPQSAQQVVFSSDNMVAIGQQGLEVWKARPANGLTVRPSLVDLVNYLVEIDLRGDTDTEPYWKQIFSEYPPLMINEAIEGGLLEVGVLFPIDYSFAFGPTTWKWTDEVLQQLAISHLEGQLGLSQSRPVKSTFRELAASYIGEGYAVCSGGFGAASPSGLTKCFDQLSTYVNSLPRNPALLQYSEILWTTLLQNETHRNIATERAFQYINTTTRAVQGIERCPTCDGGTVCNKGNSFCNCRTRNIAGRSCGGCQRGWSGYGEEVSSCTGLSAIKDGSTLEKDVFTHKCFPTFDGGSFIFGVADAKWTLSRNTAGICLARP